MKLKDIVSQLANRINQPHVIEAYLRQVYAKGFVDGTKESLWISVDDRETLMPNDEDFLIRLQDGSVRRYNEEWEEEFGIDSIVTHWMLIPKFNK